MSYFPCRVCGQFMGMIGSTWHPCACPQKEITSEDVTKPQQFNEQDLFNDNFDIAAFQNLRKDSKY